MTNVGGRLIGTNGIKVSARSFASESVLLPFIVLRPNGLSGFFHGQTGWISYNWDGGFLSAPKGTIHIATEEPANMEGTETFAANGVVIDERGVVSMGPQALPALLQPLAMFGGLGL